ncbi:hypothetical protein CKO09_10260 [Chromatium weissei]|nr:hypothetical protein [Chromatium weissei]
MLNLFIEGDPESASALEPMRFTRNTAIYSFDINSALRNMWEDSNKTDRIEYRALLAQGMDIFAARKYIEDKPQAEATLYSKWLDTKVKDNGNDHWNTPILVMEIPDVLKDYLNVNKFIELTDSQRKERFGANEVTPPIFTEPFTPVSAPAQITTAPAVAAVSTPESVASDPPIPTLESVAAQYGYSIVNSELVTPSGKSTDVVIDKPKKGRILIHYRSGQKLFTFPASKPDGLGQFLKKYWYAEKVSQANPSPIQPLEPTPAPIALPYNFAHASDEFKAWVAKSADKDSYSPFAAAKAMDEAAIRNGAIIEWGAFGGATFDSVFIDDDGDDWDDDEDWNDDENEVFDASDHWKRQPRNRRTGRWELHVNKRVKKALHQLGRIASRANDYVSRALAKNGSNSMHSSGAALAAVGHAGAELDPGAAAIGELLGSIRSVSRAFDSVTLDAAPNPSLDGYVGKVIKAGELVGRIDIKDDGKAMVFVGVSGNTRVKEPNGDEWGYTKAPNQSAQLIDWLFAGIEKEKERLAPLPDSTEPWQVTRRDWNRDNVRKLTELEVSQLTKINDSRSEPFAYATMPDGVNSAYRSRDTDGGEGEWFFYEATERKLLTVDEHQDAVKQALAAGKPVPAAVLAEYPELIEDKNVSSESEQGAFGPIFQGYENLPEQAIKKLMIEKTGEVESAYIHDELGSISFIYGDAKKGLAHIKDKRGMEFVNRIPQVLRTGRVERDSKLPRAYIVDDNDPANVAVIRLDWDGKAKTWLVTLYPDDWGKFKDRDIQESQEAYREATFTDPRVPRSPSDSSLVQPPENNKPSEPLPLIPDGAENTVKTAKGREVKTGFTVIEAADLITSHDSNGDPNPLYPAELQPRDRGRDASIAWVRKTANALDPDSLGKTRRADTGAPIVGNDRVVESGNGRTMAIQEAYRTGKAEDYRQWLMEEAPTFKLNPDKVKVMKAPVLVRVRTSELDRREFAIEANQDDKLSMTGTEKARADADRIDDALLSKLSDDGDFLAAYNRDFIIGFLASLGDAEAAQYLTTNGQPTGALIARVQAAVFAKAYSDDRLLELVADASKPEVANIVSALNSSASIFIRAKAADQLGTDALTTQVANSIETSLNAQAVQTIIDATNLVRKAKAEGTSIDELVAQRGLFGDIAPATAAMALFINKNNRSAKRLGVAFKAMAQYVLKEAEKGHNVDMFGDSLPQASLEEIIKAANADLDKEFGEGAFAIEPMDLFAAPKTKSPAPNSSDEETSFIQSIIAGNVDFYDKAVTDRLESLAKTVSDSNKKALIRQAKKAVKAFLNAEFKRKAS